MTLSKALITSRSKEITNMYISDIIFQPTKEDAWYTDICSPRHLFTHTIVTRTFVHPDCRSTIVTYVIEPMLMFMVKSMHIQVNGYGSINYQLAHVSFPLECCHLYQVVQDLDIGHATLRTLIQQLKTDAVSPVLPKQ